VRIRLIRRRVDVRGWVLPVALAAVLAVGAVGDVRCAGPAALPEDTRALVAAALAPADVVFVAPPARAAMVAAALGRPVHAGYPARPPNPIEGAARTLWVLCEVGARLPHGAGWAAPLRDGAEAGEGGGWLALRVEPATGEPVTHDLWRGLDAATAQVLGTDGGDRSCSREPEGRLRCGADDWNFVGRYVGPVGGQARRCIWAHPVSRRALRVTWPAVPFPAGSTLRGGFALLDGVPEGAPVTLRVLVGDAVRLRQTIAGKPGGWRPFSLRAAGAGPETVALSFELETTDNRWRLLCLDAVVVRPDREPGDGAARPTDTPTTREEPVPEEAGQGDAPREEAE
jgi:hypothetical protein